MKQTPIFISMFLLFGLFSCHKRPMTKVTKVPFAGQSQKIVDEHFNVLPPVTALLSLTGNPTNSTRLYDVVAITQAKWLRSADKERMHLEEPHEQLAKEMREQFEKLGLVHTALPERKSYDYVLLLGASYKTFIKRLEFLEQLSNDGLSIKKIALLGSHRPLERKYEIEPMMKQHLFQTPPLTEMEMIEALFAQSSFKMLDKKQILRISSPMKVLSDNRIVRAITADTVEDFLRTKPKPGSVLVISGQPHVLRQHLVVASMLGSEWQVETVGDAAGLEIPSSLFLDELARTLYEISKASRKAN